MPRYFQVFNFRFYSSLHFIEQGHTKELIYGCLLYTIIKMNSLLHPINLKFPNSFTFLWKIKERYFQPTSKVFILIKSIKVLEIIFYTLKKRGFRYPFIVPTTLKANMPGARLWIMINSKAKAILKQYKAYSLFGRNSH